MAAARRRRDESRKGGRLAPGPWLWAGALLGALLCLLALVCQGLRLASLEGELVQLKAEMEVALGARGPEAPQNCGESFAKVQSMEELITPLAVEDSEKRDPFSQSLGLAREKRDSSNTKKHQPKKKRSVLHLVPASRLYQDLEDLTEIEWKSSLSQGNALEVNGKSITVTEGGLYLIYSQVLFNDNTFAMGHTVTRAEKGEDGEDSRTEVLLRCVQSMPENEETAINTCYSGGVFKLQSGDVIKLLIPRAKAAIDISPDATFLGLAKL